MCNKKNVPSFIFTCYDFKKNVPPILFHKKNLDPRINYYSFNFIK